MMPCTREPMTTVHRETSAMQAVYETTSQRWDVNRWCRNWSTTETHIRSSSSIPCQTNIKWLNTKFARTTSISTQVSNIRVRENIDNSKFILASHHAKSQLIVWRDLTSIREKDAIVLKKKASYVSTQKQSRILARTICKQKSYASFLERYASIPIPFCLLYSLQMSARSYLKLQCSVLLRFHLSLLSLTNSRILSSKMMNKTSRAKTSLRNPTALLFSISAVVKWYSSLCMFSWCLPVWLQLCTNSSTARSSQSF